jgi:hypothetical protein
MCRNYSIIQIATKESGFLDQISFKTINLKINKKMFHSEGLLTLPMNKILSASFCCIKNKNG